MTTENKILVRGDNVSLTWTISGDISARKVIFVVKPNRTLTTDRTIERKNTAAGGGNTQMTVTYSAVTLLSTITVLLTPTLTAQLIAKDYYYDITSEHASNSDDHETILQGKFTLQGDVQTPYDGDVVVGSLTPNKKITFYISNSTTIVKVSSNGWTTVPTASAEIAGTFNIVSSGNEFIVGKTRIFSTNANINYPAPTTSLVAITVLEGEYPFSIDIWV